MRSHFEENQSKSPANANDTQDYLILNEEDSGEVQEKSVEDKETSEGIKMNVPGTHGLSEIPRCS